MQRKNPVSKAGSWRYACPNCGSVHFYKRQVTEYSYYCNGCKTGFDNPVDKAAE